MRTLIAACLIWISQNVAVLTSDVDCEDEERPRIEQQVESDEVESPLKFYCDSCHFVTEPEQDGNNSGYDSGT